MYVYQVEMRTGYGGTDSRTFNVLANNIGEAVEFAERHGRTKLFTSYRVRSVEEKEKIDIYYKTKARKK